MNKFILLSTAVLFAASITAQCEPDFDFGDALWGASPDPSVGEQFDVAYVNEYYSDIFHVLVPEDASAIDPAFQLPLDSVLLVSTILVDTLSLAIYDLADVGLEIICNNMGSSPNPCTLIPNGQYCASIEGTPTQAGVYQLTLEVQAYVTVFGIPIAQPYAFSGYILDIIDNSNPDGVGELESLISTAIAPNPVDGSFTVSWSGFSTAESDAFIAIYDMTGRQIIAESIQGLQQWNGNGAQWKNGVYFVALETSLNRQTSRLIIQH